MIVKGKQHHTISVYIETNEKKKLDDNYQYIWNLLTCKKIVILLLKIHTTRIKT